MTYLRGPRLLIVCGLLALAPCEQGFADFQVVTATLGDTKTDLNTNLTLAGFTAKGTLTSVSISLDDHLTLGGQVTNTAQGPRTFGFSEDSNFSLNLAGQVLLSNTLSALQGNTVVAAGATHTFIAVTSTGKAGPFVYNTGLNAFLAPSVFHLTTQTDTTINGTGGNDNILVSTMGGATVTITYQYTPSGGSSGGGGGGGGSVPEPSSIAMTLLGLTSLGLTARVLRRKTAR